MKEKTSISPHPRTVKIAATPGIKPVDNVTVLDALLADDSISEIMVNSADKVYVEKKGIIEDSSFHLGSQEAVDKLAQALIERCNKESIEKTSHIIEGMLPGGARLNIVLPPVAVDGVAISIRKFPNDPITLQKLLEADFLTQEMANFLREAVKARVNILVSGNTSSGKTTLLNVLSSFIAGHERIVTLEDTPELKLQHKNVVRLGTKGCTYEEQAGAVTLRYLVKNTMRMRPDRIIIGEVRGAEAMELVNAMNTGHSGCMSTLHANSPREALTRLTHMIHLANGSMQTKFIQSQLPHSFEVIVHTNRDETGKRSITHISELLGMEGDIFVLKDLFLHPAQGKPMPVLPQNKKMRKLRLV